MHIDVTRIAEYDLRTGIQRVVRQISRHWYALPDRGVALNFVKVGKSGSLENAWEWAGSVIDGFSPETPEQSPVLCKGDVYFALDLVLPPRGLNTRQLRQLRKTGIEIVFMVYDLLPLTHPQYFRLTSRIFFKWWASHLSFCRQILTISLSSKESIETLYGNSSERAKIESVVRVVQLSGEPEIGTKGEEALDHNLSHPGGTLFVSLGTLEPRKGYEEVLDAFEIAWDRGSDSHWWIFGARGWQISPFIKRLTQHREFGKRITWFEGRSDGFVIAATKLADALIINSKAEGLGLPILEAQQHGLGVVARDIGVFRESLNNSGILVDNGPGNVMALSKVIEGWHEQFGGKREDYDVAHKGKTWGSTAYQLEALFSDLKLKNRS